MQTIGPHFIVIGAQRSGTTWLHRVLSQHDKLWVTPAKELHYFDKQSITLGALNKYERHRARFWSWQRAAIDPRWFCRYWFLPRSDDWYGKLFRRARAMGKITGEITPAYAALSDQKWDEIHSLFPDVRLIFLMRDPIARTWSALRNNMKKGRIKSKKASKKAKKNNNLKNSGWTFKKGEFGAIKIEDKKAQKREKKTKKKSKGLFGIFN